MKLKNINFFVFTLLLILFTNLNIISASNYNNYYPSNNYYSYYNYNPKIIYISSDYKNYDGWIYSSTSKNYNSYYNYYPYYKGTNYYEKNYYIDTYYPYISYEYTKEYEEKNAPNSYSKYEKIDIRHLSRPETYVILWSYR